MQIDRWLLIVISIGMLLMQSSVGLATPVLPVPYDASYQVKSKGLVLGESEVKLRYQQNQYHYEKKTVATGLAAMLSGDELFESSQGVMVNQRFAPSAHLTSHVNKRKTRKDAFTVLAEGEIQGELDGVAYQLHGDGAVIDTSIMPLQLMVDVSKSLNEYRYQVAEKAKLKTYILKKVGEETLKLPNGATYHCDKFKVIRERADQETTIWLAKTLNYFPVRIRHRDEADVIDSALLEYKPL